MASPEQLMQEIRALLDQWPERDPETPAGKYYQDLKGLFEAHGGSTEEAPTEEAPMEEELPGEADSGPLEEPPPNDHGYAAPPVGPGGPEGGMRGARIIAIRLALDKDKSKEQKESEKQDDSG